MVKGQTQKGHRPPLSSNPKHSKNENSLKKQALGEPYAVHVRCTLLFTMFHFACTDFESPPLSALLFVLCLFGLWLCNLTWQGRPCPLSALEGHWRMAFKDNNSKSRAYFVNSGPTSQFNELSRFTCLTVVQCETLPTLVVGVSGVVLVGFVGFLGVCFPVSRSFPLTNMQSFHPSHDDLGTPPTRRPHSSKRLRKTHGRAVAST